MHLMLIVEIINTRKLIIRNKNVGWNLEIISPHIKNRKWKLQYSLSCKTYWNAGDCGSKDNEESHSYSNKVGSTFEKDESSKRNKVVQVLKNKK